MIVWVWLWFASKIKSLLREQLNYRLTEAACFLNMPARTNDLDLALLVNEIPKRLWPIFQGTFLVGFLAGLSVIFWSVKYGPLHLWKAGFSWYLQIHLPNLRWELAFKSARSRRNAPFLCFFQSGPVGFIWSQPFLFKFPVRGSMQRKHADGLGEASKMRDPKSWMKKQVEEKYM